MNAKLFAGIGALLILLAGCSKEPPREAAAAEPVPENASRVKAGTNGEVFVVLEAEAQQIMGLRVAALEAVQVQPGVKGYGRVLDPSSLATLVSEMETAAVTSAASMAELARVRTLAGQNNASDRALETAKAAAGRDKTLLDAARLRLTTSWGKVIAGRDDLQMLVKSLSDRESALVVLNVPAGEPVEQAPANVQLVSVAQPDQPVDASLIGPAPTVDPQFQGRGFWYLAEHLRGQLAPGAAVSAHLALPGEPSGGVTLPRGAAVWHVGSSWVYVQRNATSFERVMVRLAQPLKEGWFVASGSNVTLKAGDKVVVAGAQQLLSEELKGREGE